MVMLSMARGHAAQWAEVNAVEQRLFPRLDAVVEEDIGSV